MPPPDTPSAALDRHAVVRHFARAAAQYDANAAALREVRAELLSRVDYFGLEPRVVLDIGAGTGQCARALRRRFRRARVLAVDLVPAMLQAGARHARWPRRFTRIAGDACALPLRDSSCELIVANLALEWCGDLDLALAELRRVLAPPGVFLFSTLGAGTLRELRESWLTADRSAHVHDFVDMHDLGSALARAGFAEPVLDVEDYTHGFASLRALGESLRGLGAGNAHTGRARGLTSPARLAAASAAYETRRLDAQLPATFTVVYGAAFAGIMRSRRPHASAKPLT
ncbi:MAG: malonyl-ACP O-methyltransferase BioC [Steroidobacteraceae bacterium]